ncbi:E3 ubiquitin-protein ligase MARCHF5 [Anopheles bellator]|uniref:E3 ubiquitin-protein ligase MARCHF5 n=1 Tax=Anopheles bellator TaxID=139047 RepID=UPI0026498A9B|nr:E3 ubiquitin-protein ligase MARCHF5 [Anopheles bellator]
MLSSDQDTNNANSQQDASEQRGFVRRPGINIASIVAGPPSQDPPLNAEQEERYCWVCFATEEDDRLAPWVEPCNCRGATKWVHQSCLLRWIDEKQKGNPFKNINCPQCQTEYIIILPSMGSFAAFLERLDTFAKRLSPCLAAGVIACSVYWSALTFGAVTVLQSTGYEKGLSLLGEAEPYALMLCLPTIPVALILGRMFRWEDIVLRFLQKRQFRDRQYPIISLILPVNNEPTPGNPLPAPLPLSTINTSDPLSVTRIFCGALILPTVSAIVGNMFFSSVKNDLRRTILGGFAFVAVKGILKMYYHQKKYNRATRRYILDYTPENVRKYVTRTTNHSTAVTAERTVAQQQQQEEPQENEERESPMMPSSTVPNATGAP